MKNKFAENPLYEKHEAQFKRLHEFIKEGKSSSPEANQLREEMEETWYDLPQPEQARLEGLSADLYSLYGKEPQIKLTREEQENIRAEIEASLDQKQWEELLGLLRRGHSLLEPPALAYVRGLSWNGLGHAEPAYWFFREAHRLEPQNLTYENLVLVSLFQTQRQADAIEQATALLNSPSTKSQLVFGAAKVLFDVAKELPENEAIPFYQNLADALQRELKREEQAEATEPQPHSPLARLILATVLERLGKRAEALAVHSEAVNRYPEDDSLRLSRALFLLEENRSEAKKELRFLVDDRKTPLGDAYFFLAKEELLEENYEECLKLCNQALSRALSSEKMMANLLEWKAISHSELNHPPDFARSAFQSALSFDPLNLRIHRNLRIFENSLKISESSPEAKSSFEIKATTSAEQARRAQLRHPLAVAGL